MQLLFITLLIPLILTECSLSMNQVFEDTLFGRLHPSSINFPFLLPAGSRAKPLVYPNRLQMDKIQSNILDNQQNMDSHFEQFEHFRRFMKRFLTRDYRQTSPIKISPTISLEKQAYSFTAFIIPSNQIPDAFHENTINRQDNLLEDDQDGSESVPFRVNFPKDKVIQEIRSCQFEELGNGGSMNFKPLKKTTYEFIRYRVNCQHINDKVFVAVGMTHIIYQTKRQISSSLTDRVQGQIAAFADFKLRKHVFKNFDYPYVQNVPEKYWTAAFAPPTHATEVQDEYDETSEVETARQAMVEGDGADRNWTFAGELENGNQVIVRGTPATNAKQFIINLNTGTDVVLHINVRFDYKTEKDVVVLNSKINDAWGKEERNGVFPFNTNEPFDLIISRENARYEIKVNNRQVAFFDDRLNGAMVESISVFGDVEHVTVVDVYEF